MLFLNSESLNSGEKSVLKTLQDQVDAEPTFDDQAKTAKRLWEAESSKTPFREIRKVLLRMCVGVGICNYCENNEATDIDHILPKSFFPKTTFRWENYLLACKTCNSGYKLDKLAVFFPETPCTKYIVARKTQPPSLKSLMLNPRIEDPLKFLSLSLETGLFLEIPEQATCGFQRAEYTLDVLKLNARESLRVARRRTCQQIFQTLSTAVSIHEAKTFAELDDIINAAEPFITLDSTKALADLKREQLGHIKTSFRSRPHPTVWEEIKKQETKLPQFASLFVRFPDALSW